MRSVLRMSVMVVLVAFCGVSCEGQDKPAEAKPIPQLSEQMFYLTNVDQYNGGEEVVHAMRNILDPHVKIYFVGSENAIVMQGTNDQIVLARKLLSELDQPKKTYRLTYTITQVDDGKRVGTQHYSMIVVAGQRTVVKQGSKLPVAIEGKAEERKATFTYLDIGMNFDARLDEFVNGVRLQTKVEQSSATDSGVGPEDPVIRQTILEGTSFLTQGKPLMLGSLDVPGSTRRMDVEVVMEQVK